MKLHLFFFLCAIAPAYAAYEDIIIPPVANKTGSPVGLVYAQGASVKTSAYVNMARALQEQVPFPLWVGLPQCFSDICAIPGTLKAGVERVLSTMFSQGFNNSAPVFYGGHSLGGSQMPTYVNNSSPHNAAGMILHGSFLTRSFKTATTPEGRPQVAAPVPTLTIGGELDGLCRVTRIAEALYSQITFSANPSQATRSMPVTIIEGMSHIQFADLPAPAFVKLFDLKPEISFSDAHQKIAADGSAFMQAILEGSNSSHWKTVEQRVAASTQWVAPLIEGFHQESYSHFLPPCYCETKDEYGGLEYGSCESTPKCTGGVPWTEEIAQAHVAGVGVLDGLKVVTRDSIHKVTEEKPSCHLPHIHNSQYAANTDPNANPGAQDTPPLCNKTQACTLNITTVTQNIYADAVNMSNKLSAEDKMFYFSNLLATAKPEHLSVKKILDSVRGLDTGLGPVTASELRTKMKSRQAVWNAAGILDANFTETDEIVARGGRADLCAEVNQKALDWAAQHVAPPTKARFEKVGQPMVVGADIGVCIAGPCWIYYPLQYKNTSKAVSIEAPAFPNHNKNDFPCAENKPWHLPCDAGFHYCKLLSPARALEWMYVDGLRLHYGINNMTSAEIKNAIDLQQQLERSQNPTEGLISIA